MQLNELITRFDGVEIKGDNIYQAKCPSHQDANPSLSITEKGAKILLYCHSGCETKDVLSAIGLEIKDLFTNNQSFNNHNNKNNIEKVYKYVDENGKVIHEKVRYKNKGFANRFTDNEGSIFWGLKSGTYYETFPNSNQFSTKKRDGVRTKKLKKDVETVIYNLPEVINGIKENKTIYLVEGEKDADLLNSMGFTATTFSEGGGRNKFKKRYIKYFKGSNLVVIMDVDKAGRETADDIVNNLFDVVKTIKNIDLSLISKYKGFDVSDYFTIGHTKDEFIQMVEKTKVIEGKPFIIKNNTSQNQNDYLPVFEHHGKYCKLNLKGETLEISNFIIKINKLIHGEDVIEVDGDFISFGGYRNNKTFDINKLNKKANFLEIANDLEFTFTGSDNDLQNIKSLLAKQNYELFKGVNLIGFNKINGSDALVTQSKTIDNQLRSIDNIMVLDEKLVIKSDILEVEEITREELKAISPYLYNFNTLEITSSIWGTMVDFMLKPKLFENNIKVQNLAIYGEAGAGKTATNENIIIPFFSLIRGDVVDADNVTQFSLLKNLASSNVFPLVIEEYKPSKIGTYKQKMIESYLKASYNGNTAERGTQKQTIIEYPIKAPIVLIGEEGQENTAEKERTMLVNFSKMESRAENRNVNFKELASRKHLIQNLGRGILNLIIQTDINIFLKARKKIEELSISSEISDDRVQTIVANAILGNAIIGELYKKYNLDFEEETGTSMQNIIQAINKNCQNEILDGNSTTKSIIDITLELIDVMVANKELEVEEDFILINNNRELALDIKTIYPKMTKFVKNYDVKSEIISSQNQFTRQLRKTEYFIEYKAVRFSSGQYKKKTAKSYVLDITKLKFKGLDVENLIL